MILKLKNHFAWYGCRDRLISDNGLQSTSSEFRKFTKEWDFEQRTNSTGNTKANRKVKSAVKTASNLIQNAQHSRMVLYIVIHDYCNMLTEGLESSPVQHLMNRATQTLLPTTKALLCPGHHKRPRNERPCKATSTAVQILQLTNS